MLTVSRQLYNINSECITFYSLHFIFSDEKICEKYYFSPLDVIFRVDPVGISVSPIGYIRGEADELPTAFEFARDYQDGGALLTVVSTSKAVRLLSNGTKKYTPLPLTGQSGYRGPPSEFVSRTPVNRTSRCPDIEFCTYLIR